MIQTEWACVTCDLPSLPHFSVLPVLCGPSLTSPSTCTFQCPTYTQINSKDQNPHTTQYAHFIVWDWVTSFNIVLCISKFFSPDFIISFFLKSPINVSIHTCTWCHISMIQSSGGTHCGWFHLCYCQQPAIGMDVHVPVWDNTAPLGIHPGVAQSGHIVVLL